MGAVWADAAIGGDLMKTVQATADVFYTAFKAMKDAERSAFMEMVVNDPLLRDDLMDIALIEDAKKVKGKSLSAREYFARRAKAKVS